VRARLRICYQGRRYDALYGGNASLHPEHGSWRVLEVELKVLDQRAAPPGAVFRY
jgi:hypothetical protein